MLLYGIIFVFLFALSTALTTYQQRKEDKKGRENGEEGNKSGANKGGNCAKKKRNSYIKSALFSVVITILVGLATNFLFEMTKSAIPPLPSPDASVTDPIPDPTADSTPDPAPDSSPSQTPALTPDPTPDSSPDPTPDSSLDPTPGNFSVSVSYSVGPIQTSQKGIDVLVTAKTSSPATAVTIFSSTGTDDYGPFNMYMGFDGWWFNANFFEEGTYTVTITAYSADGQTAAETFSYTY